MLLFVVVILAIRGYCYSIEDDLIALFQFDGDAEDTISGIKGNVHGAELVEDRFGNDECAYEFDEPQDYIKFPNSGAKMSLDNVFTIGIWYYPSLLPVDHQICYLLVKRTKSNNNNDNYNLRYDHDSLTFMMSIFDESDNECTVSATMGTDFEESDDNWYYVVASYNTENLNLYVNGDLVGSSTYENIHPQTGTEDLRIGNTENVNPNKNDYTDACQNGDIIDQLRIYTRDLTIPEIEELSGKIPESCSEFFDPNKPNYEGEYIACLKQIGFDEEHFQGNNTEKIQELDNLLDAIEESFEEELYEMEDTLNELLDALKNALEEGKLSEESYEELLDDNKTKKSDLDNANEDLQEKILEYDSSQKAYDNQYIEYIDKIQQLNYEFFIVEQIRELLGEQIGYIPEQIVWEPIEYDDSYNGWKSKYKEEE